MTTFTDENKQHVAEIKAFLNEHNIPYSTAKGNMCLNYGTDKSFEIEYVPSTAFTVAYPRIGIAGVDIDHFYKQSKAAEEQNSFKFWVKQFEWENPNKREILKSYMLHAAGKTPTRFYARDTEVKVYSNQEIKQFQIENCFYGYRSASLNLGLVLKKDVGTFKKGTLLMVTTFGKNFFGKKEDQLEIFRVGTLRFCQVIGGASKLFQHFLRNHPVVEIGKKKVVYNKIIYYVDYDHGAGKSIAHLGFKPVNESGAGFMNYDVATKQVSHRSPMHHKEVMARVARGEVVAVPNAGVKTFEYDIDRTNFVMPEDTTPFGQLFSEDE